MKAKYKVAIVGHFANGLNFADGQTIKTRNLYKALGEELGESEIFQVDTYGYKKRIFSFFFLCIEAILKSENVVILPAHNGLKIFVPMFLAMNVVLKRKLHYAVVGGWLPNLLENNRILTIKLKKFNGIYTETATMKKNLEKMGFSNVSVIENFKFLIPLKKEELSFVQDIPHRLCTFSRVMKQKGIEDAINAVVSINQYLGQVVYTLDIYGSVDPLEVEWFDSLKSTFPEYISYKGIVDSNRSVEVLKDYFLLLFPTKFFTEGIPGTILDAFAAGVPVLASRWESFADIIDDGVTGFGYEFGNEKMFEERLKYIQRYPQIVWELKENCLRKADYYLPKNIIKKMITYLG